MKGQFLLIVFLLLSRSANSQEQIYSFRDLDFGTSVPENINSSRAAVIVSLKSEKSTYRLEADWKKFSDEVHGSIYQMGIDAVLYINANDLNSGNSTFQFYQEILLNRSVKNLIFLNQEKDNSYTLVLAPFNGKSSLISNNSNSYKRNNVSIRRLMIDLARDIKRADYESLNFLVPDKPTYLDALTIVEKSNLKNYPGQIRRSKFAVEKFQTKSIPEGASEALKEKIVQFNNAVELKNKELEEIVNQLPYDIEYIDYMSDEDLLRKRYQFVLRNVGATGESIRALLKYRSAPKEAGYVSVIPIMPDNTTIKTMPKNAIVHKFYIRQNIAKNVYVGEWDADETWQEALHNYIGNMLQFFNKGN